MRWVSWVHFTHKAHFTHNAPTFVVSAQWGMRATSENNVIKNKLNKKKHTQKRKKKFESQAISHPIPSPSHATMWLRSVIIFKVWVCLWPPNCYVFSRSNLYYYMWSFCCVIASLHPLGFWPHVMLVALDSINVHVCMSSLWMYAYALHHNIYIHVDYA